jgi:hypothetical protein
MVNTTLKKIRDQIVFHFGLHIGDDVLKNAVKEFPLVFAEGASGKTFDWSYTLANNIVTQLLAVYDTSPGTPEEKVSRLVQQLSKYNVNLCEVLDKVIAELMCNHAEEQVGRP